MQSPLFAADLAAHTSRTDDRQPYTVLPRRQDRCHQTPNPSTSSSVVRVYSTMHELFPYSANHTGSTVANCLTCDRVIERFRVRPTLGSQSAIFLSQRAVSCERGMHLTQLDRSRAEAANPLGDFSGWGMQAFCGQTTLRTREAGRAGHKAAGRPK